MQTRIPLGATIAAALPILAGCSSRFHEHHYFASQAFAVDTKTGVKTATGDKNYFRVTVDGNTALQNSRYVSGYFDPAAVEAYFGEFKQPEKLSFVPEQTTTGTTVESLDGKKSGKLVLILSANSDAVARGIGNIAQSSDLAGTIATLAAGPQLEQAAVARTELDGAIATAKAEYTALDALLGDDSAAHSREDLQRILLIHVNQVAASFGAGPFTTLRDAGPWLNQTRILLSKGVTP